MFGMMVVASAAAAQDPIIVPSGQSVSLVEVIWQEHDEPTELWARFRFLAPAIGGEGGIGFDAAAPDFAALCETVALPALDAEGREADVVVISLSDQPLEFGETNSAITQYFEAFRVTGTGCMLEGF